MTEKKSRLKLHLLAFFQCFHQCHMVFIRAAGPVDIQGPEKEQHQPAGEDCVIWLKVLNKAGKWTLHWNCSVKPLFTVCSMLKNTSYSWKAGVSNSNCLGDMMVLSFHKRRALQCSSTARMRNTSENVLFFSMETEKLYWISYTSPDTEYQQIATCNPSEINVYKTCFLIDFF